MGLGDVINVMVEGVRVQRWAQAVVAGAPVLSGDHNSAVATAGVALDVISRPDEILRSDGAIGVVQRVYHGPLSDWNGRPIPLIGAMGPPLGWAVPTGREAGLPVDVLLRETEADRRAWYGAGAGALVALARSLRLGPEVSAGRIGARRWQPAGLPVIPVLIAAGATLVSCTGLIAWALAWARAREREVTVSAQAAATAVMTGAASSQYAQRLSQYARSGVMPPPGPAEQAVVSGNTPLGRQPTREEQSARFWEETAANGGKILLWGGVFVGAAWVIGQVLPAILRARAGAGGRGA
jgi:hypothetical protein